MILASRELLSDIVYSSNAQQVLTDLNDTAMRTICMIHSSTLHTDDDKWIIDSGVSKHMVHNLGMLTHHTSFDDSPIHKVHLLTDSSAQVNNVGSTQVLRRTKISNILHIPAFHHNLPSFPKLTREFN